MIGPLRPAAVGAVALAMAAACKDAPIVIVPPPGPSDSIPPVVQILSLQPATTVPQGTIVAIDVQAFDEDGLATVDATVSGVLAFAFPPIVPNDTLLLVQFPIDTFDATPGVVLFTVAATDSALNRAVDTISFTVVPVPP